MFRIQARASTLIAAPPQVIYPILADYRSGHPGILPRRFFSGLEVERGGVGAGTVIRFQVRALGRTRTVRATVDEPEPGRILTETDLRTGAVTTFVVEPVLDGRRAIVSIHTEWTARGPGGLIERLFAPGLLRSIYSEELLNLALVAGEHAGVA